jgi:hypothetical protein
MKINTERVKLMRKNIDALEARFRMGESYIDRLL